VGESSSTRKACASRQQASGHLASFCLRSRPGSQRRGDPGLARLASPRILSCACANLLGSADPDAPTSAARELSSARDERVECHRGTAHLPDLCRASGAFTDRRGFAEGARWESRRGAAGSAATCEIGLHAARHGHPPPKRFAWTFNRPSHAAELRLDERGATDDRDPRRRCPLSPYRFSLLCRNNRGPLHRLVPDCL